MKPRRRKLRRNLPQRQLATLRTTPAELTDQGDKLGMRLRMRFSAFALPIFPPLALASAPQLGNASPPTHFAAVRRGELSHGGNRFSA